MLLHIPKKCPFCQKFHGVEVAEEQYEDYQNGMLLSKAFPDHTAAQRDAILVDICEDCHKRIY